MIKPPKFFNQCHDTKSKLKPKHVKQKIFRIDHNPFLFLVTLSFVVVAVVVNCCILLFLLF